MEQGHLTPIIDSPMEVCQKTSRFAFRLSPGLLRELRTLATGSFVSLPPSSFGASRSLPFFPPTPSAPPPAAYPSETLKFAYVRKINLITHNPQPVADTMGDRLVTVAGERETASKPPGKLMMWPPEPGFARPSSAKLSFVRNQERFWISMSALCDSFLHKTCVTGPDRGVHLECWISVALGSMVRTGVLVRGRAYPGGRLSHCPSGPGIGQAPIPAPDNQDYGRRGLVSR